MLNLKYAARRHSEIVQRTMRPWPTWWEWDIEFSAHLLKRMVDRNFTETDLRQMLDRAIRFRRDTLPGRWLVETTHDARPWHVVVEPDTIDSLLVVITAFPAE